MKKDREAWRDLREGAYMPRTNLQADSAEQMWSMYMQLTEAGLVSRAEKRAFHSAFIPSERATGEGPRLGGLSRLRLMGDAEASAAASTGDRPTTLGRRSGTRNRYRQ
jgi:hypothetical protein